MYYELDNKVILVTGASRGLGRDIAKKLALNNASIIINYKSSVGEASKLYSEIKGGQIKTHIVSKVGKKYFEVENDRSRYHLENFLADSEWTRTQLYIDDKELENKIELKILMDFFHPKNPDHNNFPFFFRLNLPQKIL